MFSTTFYSFKGGVGRTLALINVAVELAKDGNDVAIIDFDLEAPGLQTFDIFPKNSQPKVGLLEFIAEYVESTVKGDPKVPEIDRFIYQAKEKSISRFMDCADLFQADIVHDKKSGKKHSDEQGKIWLLPARGKNSDVGPTSIDWGKLYKEQDGFLLFEELKARIQKHTKADYLLIDSRTGLSDHSRICTNQLADSLAIVFFPNIQNLQGLEGFVRDIRKSKTIDEENIRFIASRLPTGDDENQILETMIEEFRKRLSIKSPLLRLHQNTSFELLQQEIFSLSRTSNTQLFRDYIVLTQELEAINIYSRRGLVQFFKQNVMHLDREELDFQLRKRDVVQLIKNRLIWGAGYFWSDPHINFVLADVFDELAKSRMAAARFDDVQFDNAAFYHALIGFNSHFLGADAGSIDVIDGGDLQAAEKLIYSFFRSELSFSDIDRLTIQDIQRLCYGKENEAKLKEYFTCALNDLSFGKDDESLVSSLYSQRAGLLLDQAANMILPKGMAIEKILETDTPNMGRFVSLLLQWRHQAMGPFKFTLKEYKLLQRVQPRSAQYCINRLVDDNEELKTALSEALVFMKLPFVLDFDFNRIKPIFLSAKKGQELFDVKIVSKALGKGPEGQLANVHVFSFLFNLQLVLIERLLLSTKSELEKEDNIPDHTPVDLPAMYARFADDNAVTRLAKAILAKIADDKEYLDDDAIMELDNDLINYSAGPKKFTFSEGDENKYFSLIQLDRVSADSIREDYDLVINGSSQALVEKFLPLFKPS